jgi:hypothetical protein
MSDFKCDTCGTKLVFIKTWEEDKEKWSAPHTSCPECDSYPEEEWKWEANESYMTSKDEKRISKKLTEKDWSEQRKKALSEASYRCESCGADSQRLHVHHRKPRSEGGTNKLSNLVVQCPDCHAEEHDAEACRLCGGIIHDKQKGWVTVYDSNGGLGTYVCETCQKILRTQTDMDSGRCGVCAKIRPNPGRSRGMTFSSKTATKGAHLCDECRKKCFFDRRRVTEMYLDEELPDDYVNFRHWEDEKIPLVQDS